MLGSTSMRRGIVIDDLRLAWYRALMGLKSESKGTRLGYLWWLIEPAMHLIVYYLAFGVLLRHGGDDYVAYLLVGIVHWLWLSKSVMNASASIMVGRGLILQLPLHVAIFPLAEIFRDTAKQLIVTLILLVVLWLLGYQPGKLLLIYPVIFLIQLLLTISLAGLVATLMPFLPDLRVIVPACLQLGMFLSGVFFTRDIIPAHLQWLLNLNPVYVLLESYREILIRGNQPDWQLLGIIAAATLLSSTLVLAMLSRFNQQYARIIQE
ncbi:ABC transporter permease [Pseudomonas sp. J452]|uniref:ABC transporter permease n=1 Tax=Pseudomonas sp. J452 TaxID=2898441 RepID=UPI0021AD71E3|nr:ABC transporter permease [Pseudomonas sp. J452]UUY09845.1 ABC transporter permease [Pseudomonas sp. J452]